MARTKKAAVISADIIGSGSLKSAKRTKLQNLIELFLSEKSKLYSDMKFEQFRGDSLQGILTSNKKQALRIALGLICVLKASSFGIRTGIGTGEISYSGKNIITSDGTAFQLSGPALDDLKKKNDLIAVKFDLKELNDQWDPINSSLNFLLKRLSKLQAEAVYLALNDLKQDQIAERLKISQPSVHQRLKSAGADVIYSILNRFETVVEKNYN